MTDQKPPLDPHPLSEYVAWAGNRNREPILKVLKEKFPTSSGNVLEFASGSGMHINFFAPNFKHLQFQPSDRCDETFENIKRLIQLNGNDNISDPIVLDLTVPDTWPDASTRKYDAIFCINIFQVAPVSIADSMMACASKLLTEDGCLLIYGPFKVEGGYTTDSNKEFDETLQSAGVPEWGLADVNDITAAASAHGMKLHERIDMPVNNFTLMYTRA
jgi:cyclopropane fatty-acyl-phospholipid synthase-like methyltransferase